MAKIHAWYCDTFPIPVPDGHRFPVDKYALLRARIESSELLQALELHIPAALQAEELCLAHDPDYVQRMLKGEMSRREMQLIGFPWSEGLVERARRSSSATVSAAQQALDDGIAVNLAGGTHHAMCDRGEGFCIFNDTVIAARAMQRDAGIGQVLVVDLDAHQGNGTARITEDDDSIFTLSLHGARNYPTRKAQSNLDVALEDDADDARYLEALASALDSVLEQIRPELVLYIAGADPWEGDRLGRLGLSKEGLGRRDSYVISRIRDLSIPMTVSMAGGYAPDVDDIVDIHYQTVGIVVGSALK